jgi:hypothetical protein
MGFSCVSVFDKMSLPGVRSVQTKHTPSASIIRISWPSIQKKNPANAPTLITRSRYVLPGSKGRVAFSLKPTALVTGEGLLPGIGAR